MSVEIIDGNKNVVEIINDQEIVVIQTVGLSGQVTTGDLALKEDVANKATDFTEVSDDLYPSIQTSIDLVSGAGAYYFTNNANDLGAGRLDMETGVPAGGGAGISFSSVTNGSYLSSFCTAANIPGVTYIPSGMYVFKVQARKTAGTKTAKLYAEIYTRTVLGVNTLIGTTSLSEELTGTNITAIGVLSSNVVRGVGATDRLLIMFKANVSGSGTDPDITLDVQGNTFSRLIVPNESSGGGGSYPYTPEDEANKATDFSTVNDTLYPSVQAVQDQLVLKLNISSAPNIEPDGNTGGFSYFNLNEQVRPLQDSANESWNFFQHTVNIDPDSSGFDLGTAGTFGNLFNIGFNHDGTSDIGNASYFNTYSELGNGTDPISVKGLQYWLGFGSISANVTITDSIQGFGMQMNVDSAAVMNGYFSGFYDSMNFDCSVGGYSSFQANPQLSEVKNNNNVSGFNANPTIDLFTGNAGYTGFSMAGQFNMSGSTSGGVQGITINPTISNFAAGHYYNGIYSSTQGITGAGTNKYAGYFDGDVNITGNLTFGGALSIGQLSAFGTLDPVVDGGGNPSSIHNLITQVNIPASATTANADTIGVNTAMLLTVGANSAVTLGALGLFAALGLPAVVETHTGSVLPALQGALFALSLSGTSTGGTINQVSAGAFLAIPNGITTVDRFYGVHSYQPFGTVGTDNWGIYQEDSEKNYMEGSLIVGTSDTPDACAAIEIVSTTKGFLNARMSTIDRNAITAVNGLQIYNTTTDKLQVYAGGSWVDLH